MPIDYKNYPPDWKLRSKFIRFYRARNKCEWCGAKNGELHPITKKKVVLTVAHIYDKNPMSACFFNLKALCQRCHLSYDRKKQKRIKQPRLPYKKAL